MKTRLGFVSNSSSSSFVIKYKDGGFIHNAKPISLLNKEQLNKLKKFGFKYTFNGNPYDAEISREQLTLKSFKKYEDIYLAHYITCNQDDVIYFLLKNKIPFVALIHYEQELWAWDGKNDYMYETTNVVDKTWRNLGKVFDSGENNQYIPSEICPTVKKHDIKQWLENEEKLNQEYLKLLENQKNIKF